METRSDGQAARGGYERRDMSVRVVGTFLLGLLVAIGVILVLMGWLFDYFSARATRLDVPPSPLAQARPLPPEPRLQVRPGKDLRALRATEDAAMNSYGWVDQTAGIVRIPIDRAMDLLAKRGLPGPPKRPAKRAGKP